MPNELCKRRKTQRFSETEVNVMRDDARHEVIFAASDLYLSENGISIDIYKNRSASISLRMLETSRNINQHISRVYYSAPFFIGYAVPFICYSVSVCPMQSEPTHSRIDM